MVVMDGGGEPCHDFIDNLGFSTYPFHKWFDDGIRTWGEVEGWAFYQDGGGGCFIRGRYAMLSWEFDTWGFTVYMCGIGGLLVEYFVTFGT